MNLDAIVQRFEAPKRTSNGYQVRCPAHEDHTQSLCIKEAEDGKNLLHCQAGCNYLDVLHQVGLKKLDLFPPNPAPAAKKIGQAIAHYPYEDVDGNVLYEVVRFKPKDFLQRRPDGKGGWKWGLNGQQTTLFHARQLALADPSKPVLLVEGERDVLSAEKLGFNATTNPMGAGKWRSHFDPLLDGRHVVIIPDNDKPGLQHALMVHESLRVRGKTASLKHLRLPGVPEKGDLSDWIAAGGTRAQLEGLIAQARPLGNDDSSIPATVVQEDRPRKHQVSTDEYVAALAALGYTFRLNAVSDDLEVSGEPMTDSLQAEIRSKMRDSGYVFVNVMEDAYLAEARKHSYHPIKQYLESLKHDGGDHIEQLAARLIDHHGVVGTWLRRWTVGAVDKVMTGSQNPMLVLDSPQGTGKSRLARWLCPLPAYFIEAPIDTDDKDAYGRLMGKWIWEVAELGATTRRADRESLKHFISMQEVTVRKAFARYDTRKPAMASFIGTVNNENGFLSDPTGNRRFLICRLESIDWSYTQLDVNQIWAQAVALWRAGESHELAPAEREISSAINETYEIDDPIEGMVKRYFRIESNNADTWTSTSEILEKLETNGLRGTTRSNAMALAATMTRLHLEKIRGENIQGQRVWGYAGVSPIVATGQPNGQPGQPWTT